MRWLKRALAALGLLALAAALGALLLVRRQLPDFATPPIPGLTGPAQVALDARGVATIRAGTLRDAFRIQGYLAARDRLFQMECQRRMADGRLSELFGPGALPADRLHRIYDFTGVAQAAVALLPPEERADLEAFAQGVNAFIRHRPRRWGLEFQLLGCAPEPWTPADSLKAVLLMNEDMSASWRQELRAEALAGLPEAARRFLAPAVTDRDALLVPDASPAPRPDASFLFTPPEGKGDAQDSQASAQGSQPGVSKARAAGQLSQASAPCGQPDVSKGLAKGQSGRAAAAALADAVGLPPGAGERPALVGSNNWVVAGWRSASGKPLLANDPHLSLMAPCYWFPVRMEVQGRWWQGAAITCAPGVILGQSDRLAWGFTNLGTDVQDLYREPATGRRAAIIGIRGGRSETLQVALGAHGPQVRAGLSLHWTALDPHNVRFPVRPVMEATDWPGFNRAMDAFPGPAMNVVYADAAGHIGWRATGLVPLRAPGQDGSRILDGADPAQDWRGFVPQAQLPRLLDPPEGLIATANQRVIGTAFPHPVATRWASPVRAQRIRALLLGAKPLDQAAMERIQLDVIAPEHREFMELAAPYLEPADRARFQGWDGAARAGSVLFTEADRCRAEFQDLLQRKLVTGDLAWPNADAALRAALGAPRPAWLRLGLGEPGALVREAWARAHRQPPRPWGQVHRLAVKHPLGRAGGVLSWLFDPPGAPQDGASHTVRVTGPEFGQSLRLAVDWGHPQAATQVLNLGVSGHLGSPHRHDQLGTWLRGDPGGQATAMAAPAQKVLTWP